MEGGIRVWRGVPYAAPPVGNLRFRPPVPPKPWSNPLPSFSSSKICAQVKSVDGYFAGKPNITLRIPQHKISFKALLIILGDEDCLYLDIYSPANATSTSKLPVMYWIYGGGFVFGDKYELGLYDAINLVGAHNYVHVAVNYRLSALGMRVL
jgi:carboxylesterase type B